MAFLQKEKLWEYQQFNKERIRKSNALMTKLDSENINIYIHT